MFGSYRLEKFPKRITQPLASPTFCCTNRPQPGEGEIWIQPEMTFDAERMSSGWTVPIIDGQDRLIDFAWDDRGYIYLAYSIYGWGIINLQGQSIKQIQAAQFIPSRIWSLKIGTSYYVIVGGGSTRVYNVTDPANPSLVRQLSFTATGLAARPGSVAVITQTNQFRIYTPQELVNDGTYTPVAFPSQTLNHVTTDGTSFYALTFGSPLTTKVFAVTTGGASTEIYSRANAQGYIIKYDGDVLAITGELTAYIPPPASNDFGAVLRREVGGWHGYDLSSYLNATVPNLPRALLYDLAPVETPTGLFLVSSYFGLGEVFQLHSSTGSGLFGETLSGGTAGFRGLAAGDLDNDGDLDVAAAHPTLDESVYLNSGTGGFFSTVSSFNGGSDSAAVALGDLDGDGDLDVVIANGSGGAETVWINGGSANFTAHPTSASFGAGASSDIALGDLDRDGDLDALVANGAGEAETVWLNDGTGAFTAHPTLPSFGAGKSTALALADLDSDGDLDAVLANDDGEDETIWKNDGTGGFAVAAQSFGGGNSKDVAVADLDGDGDVDIVVANGAGTGVWLNDGSAAFTLSSTVATEDSTSAALADLDGDGDRDLVVSNTIWAPVSLNNGAATFSGHSGFFGPNSTSIVLGDVDGDGDPDAIAAGTGGIDRWINLNRTSTVVGSSPAPSFRGESVTLTATVSTPTGDALTGTVSFRNGGTELGSAPVSGNVAAISTSTLPLGTNAIGTTYEAGPGYADNEAFANHQVNALIAPASLTAAAATQTQVNLSWPSVRGGSSYEIHRSPALDTPYELVGTAPGTTYSDTTAAPNTSYLYKVRALGIDGTAPFSPMDPATTVIFADPSLVGMAIKTVHFEQLRTAVSAMRSAATLSPASFTDATLVPEVTPVLRTHVVELRAALDAALAAMGLPPIVYTDPDLTAGVSLIRKEHVTDLRAGTQ